MKSTSCVCVRVCSHLLNSAFVKTCKIRLLLHGMLGVLVCPMEDVRNLLYGGINHPSINQINEIKYYLLKSEKMYAKIQTME